MIQLIHVWNNRIITHALQICQQHVGWKLKQHDGNNEVPFRKRNVDACRWRSKTIKINKTALQSWALIGQFQMRGEADVRWGSSLPFAAYFHLSSNSPPPLSVCLSFCKPFSLFCLAGCESGPQPPCVPHFKTSSFLWLKITNSFG